MDCTILEFTAGSLKKLFAIMSKGGMDDRIFAIANIHPRFFQQHRLESLVQLKTRPGKGGKRIHPRKLQDPA